MKKIVTCLSLIATVFLLGSTNVYALISSEAKGISNLCVKKDETSITIRFDVNQDMDFSTFGMLNVYGEDPNYNYFNREGEKEFKIVNNSITCDSENVSGTEITESTKITAGSTLYLHKELESSDFNKLIVILEYINDDNDRFGESIIYNVNESSIESVESYNMSFSDRVIDAIAQKYNNYIIPLSGDEYGMGFYFDVDKGQNEEYPHAVELGWIDFSDYTRSEEEILKEIADLIIKANVTIPFKTSNSKMTNDYFEGIKTLKKVVTYEQKVDNKVNYAWSFDGSKIKDTNLSVDLTLNIGKSANQEKIEALVPTTKKSLVLEFAHHGILPEGTSVKVNVLDKFQNGKKVALYYYNEGKLEEVAKNLEVKNGFVEFALEHCSDYVLVEESNNAQTGTLNVVLYGGLAIVSLLGIGYLLVSKKKNM